MTDEFAVIPYSGEHSDDDLDLFGEYRYLFPILLEGRRYTVPEDNCVLRACQYVEITDGALRMPWRDYCWNNTAGCCAMPYREVLGGPVLVGRACRVQVRPGMEILRLPRGGRWCTPPR